jgi:phosphoserine aminotransferase
MNNRVHNFSAGPSALPVEVLAQAARDLVCHPEFGMSIMEMSHRSPGWVRIQEQIEANLRQLAQIPDEYAVLFLQGGATTQFASVPLNLLPRGASADYILTGAWSVKALREAGKVGLQARPAGSSEKTGFDRIPTALDLDPKATYVHYTSNNTIYGTQWSAPPQAGGVPLVCDASSDIFCRPLELSGHDLVYAGAQKNIGPAGVTLVIVRRDVLDRVPEDVPTMLAYKNHAARSSAYNTPPVWPIYMVGLVIEWMLAQGGLAAIESRNRAKAGLLYGALDASDFYRGLAQPESRSLMNVTFALPDQERTALFLKEAQEHQLHNLKGYRTLGGCRASIYNAVSMDSVQALVDFMRHFEAKHG